MSHQPHCSSDQGISIYSHVGARYFKERARAIPHFGDSRKAGPQPASRAFSIQPVFAYPTYESNSNPAINRCPFFKAMLPHRPDRSQLLTSNAIPNGAVTMV